MSCNHEDLQRALRISNAIQEYFRINYNYQEVRSTDLYEFLAKRELIERDRHQGLHFRAFLQKLNKNGCLGVIPQCSYTVAANGGGQWHFTYDR